jgi:nucleoside-diphosphate-sugar epimerase
MKVVVTGGSGLLGRRVVADLTAHGYEVLSLDRSPHPDGFKPAWSVDLLNVGHLYEACRGAGAIVHLAAYIAPNLTSDTNTFNSNVALVYNALKVAADLKIARAVVASSTAAYGYLYGPRGMVPDYLPVDEDHPCRPVDPYGLSKVVGERIADSFASTGTTSVASLRFPGVNYDPACKLIFERQANPAFRTPGFWAYVDARDAARACRLALEADFSGHRIWNIAAPTGNMREPTTELVARFLPGVKDVRPGSDPLWSGIDSSRAERELGFKAEHVWQGVNR